LLALMAGGALVMVLALMPYGIALRMATCWRWCSP
jgi:hypothetical protein